MERKEAIEVIKKNYPDSKFTMLREALETLIPELKESEDEKIREWLISQLKIKSDDTNSDLNIMINKAIDWLEKRGEQKQTVIIPRFRVGDVITSTKNAALKYKVKEVGILNELGEYDYVVEDVTDTDYKGRIHKMSISKVDEWGLLVDDKPQGKSAIEAIKEEKVDNANKVEQKSAWSEEDEEMLNSFLYKLEVCYLLSSKEGIWIKNKLKALKDRVQLQSTWKPRNEQIAALELQLKKIYSEDPWLYAKLKELLEQLKKLNEE